MNVIKCSHGSMLFEREVELRKALSRAIKSSGYSREQVAQQMADAMGVAITKAQIDSWTAESKAGENRMPATYLPFFCFVVGDRKPLEVCAGQMGLWLGDSEDKWHVNHSKAVLTVEELRNQRAKE